MTALGLLGQMMTSLLLENKGWLATSIRKLNKGKIVGLVVVCLGRPPPQHRRPQRGRGGSRADSARRGQGGRKAAHHRPEHLGDGYLFRNGGKTGKKLSVMKWEKRAVCSLPNS